jgi:hypothetical protein
MKWHVCMGRRLVEAVEARGGVVLPLAEGNKGERREGEEGAVCVPVTTPDGDVLGALQVTDNGHVKRRGFESSKLAGA